MDSPDYAATALRILSIAGVEVPEEGIVQGKDAFKYGKMVRSIVEELIAVRESKHTSDPDVLFAVLGSTDGRGYNELLALFTQREDAERLRNEWPYLEEYVPFPAIDPDDSNPLSVVEVKKHTTTNLMWPPNHQGGAQFRVKLVASYALSGFVGLDVSQKIDRRIYRTWEEFFQEAKLPWKYVAEKTNG